jgi:hypothetical protein
MKFLACEVSAYCNVTPGVLVEKYKSFGKNLLPPHTRRSNLYEHHREISVFRFLAY